MGLEISNQLFTIQSEYHNRVLILRAFERLLNSDAFENALQYATDGAKAFMWLILANNDLNGLRKWIIENTVESLEDWSHRRLRDFAKQENIPRYSRMDKEELITEIQKCSKPTQTLPNS